MSERDLTDALERLTGSSRFGGQGKSELAGQKVRGDKPAQQSSARNQSAPGAGGTVLTETNFSDREFHPPKQLTSTDGLVTIVLNPIKKMVFKNDTSGQIVMVNFSEPDD